DAKSKINPAIPKLADLRWIRSGAQPLDLTEVYQTSAAQFVKATTFPWRAVPHGPKTLSNVPFAIDGRICLWGAQNAKRGLVFPEKSGDISVIRKFETLYVYHATFFSSPEGSPVYGVTLQYADGTSSTSTICYGTHVRDWYQFSEEPLRKVTD